MFASTRSIFAILFFAMALSSLSAQESFTHEGSGLTFTLPAGWTYTHEEDHFEASSPDESVALLFFVGHGSEVGAAIDGAVDELSYLMQDPKITTELTEARINGLVQTFVEGDGVMEDVVMDWDLTLIQGSRRSMVIVAIGDIEGNQRAIDGIYQSIRE